MEYLELLAQIYDHIEETGQQAPYTGVRVLALKFFKQRELLSVEQKTGQFLIMCIEELRVLKDFHDQSGQRMVEISRSGKQLLQLVEQLLSQRVKYSGTGAETLMATLNDALTTNPIFSKQEALEHHRSKIKAYKDDLKRIEEKGVHNAELLPVPHSIDALFAQAEGAAEDILVAVEDVKQAIENERKKLAHSYLNAKLSSGQSVNTVAEFYEQLHLSTTYQSYIQAKDLFSFLEGYGSRFPNKNIAKLLEQLEDNEKIPRNTIKRSQLNGFKKQFDLADTAIQEKTRAQLQLLQLQVRYSLATDVKGLQTSLKSILQAVFKNKDEMTLFFEKYGFLADTRSMGLAAVELFGFEHQEEINDVLSEEEFEEGEKRRLIEALLQAEETTLKQIVSRFKRKLETANGFLRLSEYDFQYGLAEYYVLTEIELFNKDIVKAEVSSPIDLEINLKGKRIMISNAECFEYTLREAHGTR